MVGFVNEPTTILEEEQQNQDSKLKSLRESGEFLDPKFIDFSIDDSFIDFDSIREFFQGAPDLDQVSLLDRIEMEGSDKSSVMEMGVGDKDCGLERNPVIDCSNLVIEDQSCGFATVKDEKLGNLGCFIEEEMGKVSLVGECNTDCGDETVVEREIVGDGVEISKGSLAAAPSLVISDQSGHMSDIAGNEKNIGDLSLAKESSSVDVIESGVSNEVMIDEDESGSDSESESESSSSSASSSGSDDDEDEEEEKEEEVNKQLKGEREEGEVEEGEIRDLNGEQVDSKIDEEEEEDEDDVVEWNGIEFDDIDEEEDAGVSKGPIRSQNELKFLPPVPPVDVTLQPHHHMLPVGVILSIMSSQVIVEAVEKHNPLNEGSILWITEQRCPLGLVDEIFGPVQNPYYIVRYNSESEVPSDIGQGTSVSFVPEFANHVLSEKNIYKKGYDASGENDEEESVEAEFSDDEKEAEYLRMKKMSKRGMNDKTVGSKKNRRSKDKNGNGNRKKIVPTRGQASTGRDQPPPNQNQHNASAVASMGNYPSSSANSGAGFFQPFSPGAPNVGVFQPPHGIWNNGLSLQQPQNTFIPGGVPANMMSWPAQNQLQHPCQMPMTNAMPFQQQFNPSQGPLLNGGQPNLFTGLPSPWPAGIGQNCFNQAPFGMGLQVQPTQPTMNAMNVGQQGMMSSGFGMAQNHNLHSPAGIPGNVQAPQQFNSGSSPGRGRRQYHRGGGGGRFTGGRGRFSGGRGHNPS
ncbi:uncharacterized protein LOC126655882 [Mercurialis annua]|uniref:uncharacterized protein LOC126655882 n=1 Tax=Mercurialis annua TaxID=3986 RepID=UPI00215E1F20|nr:uncharacterized protein LOC126655882 [Mercurialis annua]